uniref:TetR/AcrR family transcriptional regulator n=1 Tax=Pontixanthobacter aquaemixtae TaxID=1958940 RepID=A0A844ZSU9_9SPHN|nr:TetR/AcrR family transcriptional regulator [Pontixanthobacter aquaemixtae]MXO89877.1 TetR/AcrR family transcriptional regulator [Pontixanthobacter aquaemixtae]
MELTRAKLFDLIWSEPIGKVAERFGMTGNGLAKICDRLNIPRPGRSHWTRAAERRDSQPDLPPPPIGLSEIVAFGKRQTRQSPGVRRRLDTESRVRQLMELATAIAINEGLNALTIRRLAQDAGISETQVHNCFGGRSDLLVAMAKEEISKQESSRQKRISRSGDRHTKIVLSTVGYLHESAQRGPLLQMLLRVPEVKSALQEKRATTARTARAPILERLTGTGRMDMATARASTAALTAVSLKAGGIIAGQRAPFATVEQLCLSVVLAGVASDDELSGS